MADGEALAQLEKLGELKSKGIISEAEFELKKHEILNGSGLLGGTPNWDSISVGRKRWFAILWCLLFWPVGLWLVWRNPLYRKHNGQVEVVKSGEKTRITLVALLLAVMALSSLGS